MYQFYLNIYTAGPQIMLLCSTSFHSNTDDMPQKHNSHLHQLAYVKLVLLHIISLKVAETTDII